MANIDLATYVAKIEADDSGLKQGLKESDNMIKNVLEGAGLKTKLTTAAIATAIGVTLKKSVDSFVEFENQMNSVYTLLPDISESAMSQMEDQVRSLSKEMGVLPNELIPALYSSLSASVPEDNVFEFLETAQKGAIAGMTETETVVDGLTTVINSYHMEATEAEKVSDILFNTIKFGKTSMEELSGSMSQVTPIASSLGVDFEDIGAALATMTAQGNSTATSTTQLKQMFNELSKAGGDTAQIFEEIAGKSFKEFIAEGHNVNDALQLMEEYAKDNNVEINDLFGSVQAGQAALMLTGESADLFATNIERMGDAAGATEEAYQTMDQSIGRSFEKIKVAMHDMLLELGTQLAPAVQGATDFILMIMPVIETVVGTAFAGIGVIIQGFVGVINTLVERLQEFYYENEEIFNSIFETIEEVFDAILEIVQGFIGIFQNLWDKYGEYITTITQTMWNMISGIFKNALNIIQGILDTFIGLATGDWKRMGEGFKTIGKNMWNAIQNIFRGSLNIVKNIMRGFISILTNVAKSIMQGIWNGFKSVWNRITGWVRNAFRGLTNTIKGFRRSFFNAGRNIFTSVWDGMKSIWTGLRNWVSDKVSWMSNKLAFWRRGKSKMSKNVPSYDVGTPFVPNDQLAYIHKGEAVIPAEYNPFNPRNKNNKGIGYSGRSGVGGGNTFNSQYDIQLKVEGNLDRDVLPDVKRMIDSSIRKAQDRQVHELNKRGVFRPI